MAERPKIHSYPEGILGKTVVVRFLQRRAARRAATHSVHEKNTILKGWRVLAQLIAEHRLKEVREKTQEIVESLQNGLQETYDVMFEEFLLMQEELLMSLVFLRKHGAEMRIDDIENYRRFTEEAKETLELLRKYINELRGAIKGEENPAGALYIETGKYNIGGTFDLLRPFFEWFKVRSTINRTFKIEQRLMKSESQKKETPENIQKILKLEKNFAEDMQKTVKTMCIFSLLMIRSAYKAGDEIFAATKEGRWDLPKHYDELSMEITHLLNDEWDALESLNKARIQIENTIKKVESSIDYAKDQRKKAEVQLKRAA